MAQTIKKTKTLDEILISKQPLVSNLPNAKQKKAGKNELRTINQKEKKSILGMKEEMEI